MGDRKAQRGRIGPGAASVRPGKAVGAAVACLLWWGGAAQARYRDGMTLYQYVQGSPQSQTDPAGLQASRPAPPAVPVPAWVKDADDLLDTLYGDVYKARQKDLTTVVWVQQWRTNARNKIEDNLCKPSCIGPDPVRKASCRAEAGAIAEAYVDMFIKYAYSKDSLGVHVFRETYSINLPKAGVAGMRGVMGRVFKNADPWDNGPIHGGWMHYQWAWLTANAVDSALRQQVADRQKEAAKAQKEGKNATAPALVIKYYHAGEHGKDPIGGMEGIRGNWVVLMTQGQKYCLKIDKEKKPCQVWLDPWPYPKGKTVVEPSVWLSAEHSREWNFIPEKPTMFGVRAIGNVQYDRFIPKGKVGALFGTEYDYPGRAVGIGERIVPKGWTWSDPETLGSP